MKSLERIVRQRIELNQDEIWNSVVKAAFDDPLSAETNPDRFLLRLRAKFIPQGVDSSLIDQMIEERIADATRGVSLAEVAPAGPKTDLNDIIARCLLPRVQPPAAPEKTWGDTIDFVNVAFLERGVQMARSVGRVVFANGSPLGSGVLVGEDLFLTNHHVIENPGDSRRMRIEFDYEIDMRGRAVNPTTFEFDPDFFVTDAIEGLDFTLIGVGPRRAGSKELSAFGFSGLSGAADKHMLGEFANIVQHPDGRYKQVVIRENRLVGRFQNSLHYVADTNPGSSGSPVFNSEWQMIALHHWGGPWIDQPDQITGNFEINEGIRISSIVNKLRARMRFLPVNQRSRVVRMLALGERTWESTEPAHQSEVDHATQGLQQTITSDGRMNVVVPIEISVRIPMPVGDSAETDVQPDPAGISDWRSDGSQVDVKPSTRYADRYGHDRRFIVGFDIPLPELSPENSLLAAELVEPEPGTHPFELRYHHFSVVMNRVRRIAFFTVCDIDGSVARSIGRTSRVIADLSSTDPGLREALSSLNGSESDSWSYDDRISRDAMLGGDFYARQRVAGFPNTKSGDRIARVFQKGHLVRRLDPAWGDVRTAIEAELDTFHWTNAAPQVGFFNMGRGDATIEGTGTGNLWRSVENYVLRNAVASDSRVVSFTGPLFREDDRLFRDVQVPARFFKVTVWATRGELRSIALIADQSLVYGAWPESTDQEVANLEDVFVSDDELAKVADFLSTVTEIEKFAGIDFGKEVRDADVRAGQSTSSLDGPKTLIECLLQGGDKSAIQSSRGEDSLREINGIGTAMENALHSYGIRTFREIAKLDETGIDTLDARLGARGRIRRDSWVDQAKRLVEGKHDHTDD